MCQFDIPSFTYYTHLPILLVAALVGFFILKQNKKSPVNINFFIVVLIFCFWIINDLFQWVIADTQTNLLLSRLSIFECFASLFYLYFILSFTEKNIGVKLKILLALPFLPIVIFAFSRYNVSFDSPVTCNPQLGWLYYYMYALLVIYGISSAVVLIFSYRKKGSNENSKRQILITILALAFLILWSITVLELTDLSIKYLKDDQISQSMPLGVLIFIVIITYAITKYKLFNIKLIAAQALVVGLVILIGSEFFFIQSTTNIILTLITLLIALGFGYMLVRSVKLEVENKERLQNLSDQLAIANDKLRQLDKAKSEFISIASHQLRTPLTSIKGFGSLLLEGTYGEVPEAQRGALEKIYISNERLIQLVEDLLNISRIEAGRMEFDFQEAQIEDLVSEAVTTLELSAKAKNLYLTWEKPAIAMPKLKIDITKIKEVISNMVDNSIKYTQKGGITVKLETNTVWDSEHKEHQSTVRVIVSDTGIGMDEEELAMIFEKFQRGKEVAHYHTDGTGLGMYIGKKIVAEHKGRIWAESDGKGKGSRFILELPVN